jgi:EpsI family protein
MTALHKNTLCAAALCALMFMAAGAAVALKPTALLADKLPPIDLEAQVPRAFGSWRVDERMSVRVVNPQAETLVNKLYSQVLTRTYVDSSTGERIMLSIAYGRNQSDALQGHLPDVCYPAQGFEVLKSSINTMARPQGSIQTKQLLTRAGDRLEPLTYWTTVGDKVAVSHTDRKRAQFEYALRGLIPDGVIFRVSSIGPPTESAWALQRRFIGELAATLAPSTQVRVMGR